MTEISADKVARMNAAIEKLDIPEGTEMKFTVGHTKCVKSYLEVQQRIVNSDTSGSYPAFLRIVEVFNQLKNEH